MKKNIIMITIILLMGIFLFQRNRSNTHEETSSSSFSSSQEESRETLPLLNNPTDDSWFQEIPEKEWTRIDFGESIGMRKFHYVTPDKVYVDFVNPRGDTLSRVSPESFLIREDMYVYIYSSKEGKFKFTLKTK
jgi:hypothetical protein